MSEYTAEDFKNANIAVRGTLHAARRAEPDTTLPWVYGDNEWDDDKGMVENGWRPVHEHNPHATDALEEEIQDLRDENAGLKMRVEYLNGELALWQERASQAEAHARKAESAPLTLDTLREAWENAEVLTGSNPVQEGDELIYRRQIGGFGFRAAECADDGASAWRSNVRVHRRAPQPEPWQSLADVLGGWLESPTELAKYLHEKDVRVTGGDET